MASNAIKSDFRSSKMAVGIHFLWQTYVQKYRLIDYSENNVIIHIIISVFDSHQGIFNKNIVSLGIYVITIHIMCWLCCTYNQGAILLVVVGKSRDDIIDLGLVNQGTILLIVGKSRGDIIDRGW